MNLYPLFQLCLDEPRILRYSPSCPEKRRVNLSYAAVVTNPVNRSKYFESERDNIDLTSDESLMLGGFTNVSKLLELEKSITSIELDRVSLNTAQSTIFRELKQVIQATLAQSNEINAMQ
jgi:hypothetical protein